MSRLRIHVFRLLALAALCVLAVSFSASASYSAAEAMSPAAMPNPPSVTQKLIFIHHSCGSNWLSDSNGGLGIALRDNNYFVSDTNYGWGPDDIGSRTDIGHWWTWFNGPSSGIYTVALYAESEKHASYSRLENDPIGENAIILFKSCYPNSNINGKPDEAPTVGDNPLRGAGSGSSSMTVGNTKGIYNDLLPYFAQHQDKLFIVITAPPLAAGSTDATRAANARALNDWLVNDWLDAYPYDNVTVFDFYNVLTSNGGDSSTNDLDEVTGNHHRWRNDAVEHSKGVDSDVGAYVDGDSHPKSAGNRKATAEFVPLLNYWVSVWQGGEPPVVTGPPRMYIPAIVQGD